MKYYGEWQLDDREEGETEGVGGEGDAMEGSLTGASGR